ncbi:MAG: squalene cyclase [Ornithinimicrobium sp.]|uniref:squalene cyclase n=1 Tax=Ornithinimicrobium sp. TaxID=1977084 RepID=UPI003D9BA9BB
MSDVAIPMQWLLDTDPALRWQVERDLAGPSPQVWQATRSRVATEGFGARLLALQDPDGQWAGGAFFPGRVDDRPFDPHGDPDADPGQPWTATTWSLNALREWGIDAQVLGDTAERLAASCRWEYDDLPYWGGEVDCCINAFTLANGTWLGADVSGLEQWFVEHQMDDGGWNCEWEAGSTRSSFVSTLNTLEGLLYREQHTGTQQLRAARRSGEEYLLARRLMLRRSSGEVVGPWVTHFAYPFRAMYSALRATDYFRRASLHDASPPDPRLADAIEAVRSHRESDGTWRQQRRHAGVAWFEVDVAAGEPSPWLTLYGTRVLAWWDDATRAEAPLST